MLLLHQNVTGYQNALILQPVILLSRNPTNGPTSRIFIIAASRFQCLEVNGNYYSCKLSNMQVLSGQVILGHFESEARGLSRENGQVEIEKVQLSVKTSCKH